MKNSPFDFPIPKDRDAKEIASYLCAEGEKLTSGGLAGITSAAAVQRRQPELRRQWRFMLGLDPWPRRGPLHATITGRLDRAGYTIEKIHFQSVPGLYVTGNLYLPKSPKRGAAPYPAVVYGCGHRRDAHGAKHAYQYHGPFMATHGYVTFLLDPLQIGEIMGIHLGPRLCGRYDWYAAGYTPIGVEVWNAMRAVDYLCSRKEVDADRIGITGHSGGATLSWFTSALDERLKIAAPINGVGSFASYVKDRRISSCCDCSYPINVFRFGYPTITQLIVPRPLLVGSSTDDQYNLRHGYRRVMKYAYRTYDLFGQRERVSQCEQDGPHKDVPPFRRAVLTWFNRWLKGTEEEDVSIPDLPPEPGRRLLVFGGRPPKDQKNSLIQDTFVPSQKWSVPRALPQWRKVRTRALRDLREYVFRVRPTPGSRVRATVRDEQRGGGCTVRTIRFDSEPGTACRAKLYLPDAGTGRGAPLPLLYVAGPGENEAVVRQQHIGGALGGGKRTALLVHPRGASERSWAPAFENWVVRSAMLTGRTVDAMRLYDVLLGVDLLGRLLKRPRASVALAGTGAMGIVALYAGLLDSRVKRVVLSNPPATHRDKPLFLNVLRFLDIPQAAALFAPRPLLCIGPVPDFFSFARRVYAKLGRPDLPASAANMGHALRLGVSDR